jgi:signal transduction histidine kinase
MMIHYSIAQFLNAFTTLVLGLFVYLKNTRSLVNKMFVLHSLAIAIWAFSFAQMALSQSEVEGLFWSRALHVGAILIPVFLLHFICAFLNIAHAKRKVLIGAYLIGFSMLGFVPTNLFVSHTVSVVGFSYFVGPAGFWYHLFPLFFFVCAVYAFYLLFKGIKNSQGLRKNQIKYLFVALLIGYSGGPTGFLPLYNIPMPPWGLYTVSIFAVIVTYAIVKYRLMDINIAIKRGTVYASLALLATGISIGLVFGADRVFGGYPGYNSIIVIAIILLIIIPVFTYALPWARPKAEHAIEKILYKNKYAYLDTLRDFSQRMTFILNQEELMQSIVKNVVELMGVTRAYVFLANEVTGKFELKSQTGDTFRDDFILPKDSVIIEHLMKNRNPFVKEEMERILPHKEMEEIEVDLKSLGAVLCIPLITEDELIGICVLGEKVSREMFSHLDIELLETLANQIALIVNYKRMEEQLRRQDKLIGLATMAAGIGHEIGNAIVSVQTFLQLFPERRLDDEFCKKFGKTARQDAQRIAQLVEMMRKLAQPRSGLSEFQSLDIRKVIEQAISFSKKFQVKKKIKITKQFGEVPNVKGDASLLLMAFLNLLRNSIDVLSEGGEITVSISTDQKARLDSKQKNHQYLRIEISDNGPGISKDHLSRIFEPFFTTRFDGTGLGLPLVHRVIEEHGGNIIPDTRVGKGTTFIINVPIEAD